MRIAAHRLVPSPALVIGVVALAVALSGTAYAVTISVVNIADPGHPNHRVQVSSGGALKTFGTATVTGAVAPRAPGTPLFGQQYLSTGAGTTVIPATKAAIALNRLVLENYYDQTGGATAMVMLNQTGGSTTTCDGSSGTRMIGRYEIAPGSVSIDDMPTPVVLRPFAAGHVWCLDAIITLQGDPGGYYLPSAAWSGFLVSGTAPPHTASGQTLRGRTSAVPPKVTAR